MLFIYLDTENEENSRITEFFGLKEEEVPAVRLIQLTEDMAKYRPETTDLDTDTIRSFVQSFVDGKLKVSGGRAPLSSRLAAVLWQWVLSKTG